MFLQELHSFRNMPRSAANMRLRTIAFRTFVGSVCTLLSSIVYIHNSQRQRSSVDVANSYDSNLTVLMALNGEPGWVCLMCCNSDSKYWFMHDELYNMGEINPTQSCSPRLSFNGLHRKTMLALLGLIPPVARSTDQILSPTHIPDPWWTCEGRSDPGLLRRLHW